MTKIKEGDTLYYVNPFVFTIELVRVDMSVKEDDGFVYWIDHTGAYLHDFDLFHDLTKAKEHATMYLEKMIERMRHQIKTSNPTELESF